jgi:hypothetical protein
VVSNLFIRKILFALACATLVSLLPSFGFSSDVVAGKISKVRLYTDRAEITRSIQRKILAGKSQFSVGPLPDSVRPNSVRVSLVGNSPARLVNVKKSEILLTLKDQLPLSYQENIEVKTNDISPTPKKVDEKNIITWEINLKPNEKKTLRIDYQVEYPAGKSIKGL